MDSGGGVALLLGLLVFSADLLLTQSEDHAGYCRELPIPSTDPAGARSCSQCKSDANCPPAQKCCSSVCGNTCQTPEPNRCRLPPVTGPCKARMPRYYYNWGKKRCEVFIYGGCGGNLNRFDTLEMCQRACRGRGAS